MTNCYFSGVEQHKTGTTKNLQLRQGIFSKNFYLYYDLVVR